MRTEFDYKTGKWVKTYLVPRKLPTYDDLAKHYAWKYSPGFEFDHESPSRGKFRRDDGVTVYESGYTEVRSYVWKNPDLRHRLEQNYGLTFLPPSESRGIKYFTPDGDPVAIGAIATSMLFLDQQTMRAYGYTTRARWGDRAPFEYATISFAAPGAVPVAHSKVHTRIPDHKRVRAVLKENKEFFQTCAVTAKLLAGSEEWPVSTNASVGNALQWLGALLHERPHADTPPLVVQCEIGLMVTGGSLNEKGLRAHLTELSATEQAFPYLNIVIGGRDG